MHLTIVISNFMFPGEKNFSTPRYQTLFFGTFFGHLVVSFYHTGTVEEAFSEYHMPFLNGKFTKIRQSYMFCYCFFVKVLYYTYKLITNLK